jgi:hypothetical protein
LPLSHKSNVNGNLLIKNKNKTSVAFSIIKPTEISDFSSKKKKKNGVIQIYMPTDISDFSPKENN